MSILRRIAVLSALLPEESLAIKSYGKFIELIINPSVAALARLIKAMQPPANDLRILQMGDNVAVANAYEVAHWDMAKGLSQLKHSLIAGHDIHELFNDNNFNKNLLKLTKLDNREHAKYKYQVGSYQVKINLSNGGKEIDPAQLPVGLRRALHPIISAIAGDCMSIYRRSAILGANRQMIYFTYMGEYYRTDNTTWDKLAAWVNNHQSVPHLDATPWQTTVRKLRRRPSGVSVHNIEPEPKRQNNSYR
jgi:hypothetical protein